MNFLIISEGGDGVGLALRLKEEGHDARIWIRDPQAENRCRGLVDTAEDYTFGQTVIADCTGAGSLLDKMRDADIPTIGGSSFADKLESDRRFAEEVFRECGIKTPESKRAETWEDAGELVRELGRETGRVVLKPEGKHSGVLPSYVSFDLADALRCLKLFRAQTGDEIDLVVQEYIEGIAISTEGWFNGAGWYEGMFNHTIERKQFLNDDLGPSGGCTGNLVWRTEADDPLVRELLTPLTKTLALRLYRGAIDVNAVVNQEGVYALEFTPRFGYDAFPTLLHTLCNFPIGTCLDNLARGYDAGEALREGFGAGVRLSIPPWPSEEFHAKEGVPIQGLPIDGLSSIYPYEIQLNKEGELESCCGYGILGVVNGWGDSIGEAFSRAYSICDGLRVPGKQYRTDLAQQCLKDYRELAKLGGGIDGGWIGVDLDGTLAMYSKFSESVGVPIPKMVDRVRRWVNEGKEVRVLTARAAHDEKKHERLLTVHDWIREHVGHPLEITAQKDYEMEVLWDDRVVEVVPNEGTRA